MSDTPILDASMRAAIAPGGNIEEVCLRFIRAALPWDLPAERLEVMAAGFGDVAGLTGWVKVARCKAALATYRADPLMRELWPERFCPRDI
jgi:hypothetical protein